VEKLFSFLTVTNCRGSSKSLGGLWAFFFFIVPISFIGFTCVGVQLNTFSLISCCSPMSWVVTWVSSQNLIVLCICPRIAYFHFHMVWFDSVLLLPEFWPPLALHAHLFVLGFFRVCWLLCSIISRFYS